MPTISAQQAANLAEYNSRQLVLNPNWVSVTDQQLFDFQMEQLVTTALQPLRDAEVKSKEAIVAAKDPTTLKTLQSAADAKKQQAEADYVAALTAAVNAKP